ncbi:MAG TPA: luciferase family protein [Polyangiaceae bacterium]|nr:luciferase family protein [Polyangiaceae bacterium]
MHARPVADALIKAGLGRRFEWSPQVVVFDIRKQADVAHALWLFELSYDRRRGSKNAELLARITAYVDSGIRSPRRVSQP